MHLTSFIIPLYEQRDSSPPRGESPLYVLEEEEELPAHSIMYNIHSSFNPDTKEFYYKGIPNHLFAVIGGLSANERQVIKDALEKNTQGMAMNSAALDAVAAWVGTMPELVDLLLKLHSERLAHLFHVATPSPAS